MFTFNFNTESNLFTQEMENVSTIKSTDLEQAGNGPSQPRSKGSIYLNGAAFDVLKNFGGKNVSRTVETNRRDTLSSHFKDQIDTRLALVDHQCNVNQYFNCISHAINESLAKFTFLV